MTDLHDFRKGLHHQIRIHFIRAGDGALAFAEKDFRAYSGAQFGRSNFNIFFQKRNDLFDDKDFVRHLEIRLH